MPGEILGEIWGVAATAGPVDVRIFARGLSNYSVQLGNVPVRVVPSGVPLSSLTVQNLGTVSIELGNDQSLVYGNGMRIPPNSLLSNGAITGGGASILTIERFARASMPAAAAATLGRVIELSDSDRSIWLDDGVQMASLTGEVIDARRWNAVGDGAANDTAALQGALNAVRAGGGIVFLPPGTFRINATLVQAQANTKIVGSGKDVTRILAFGAIRMVDSNGLGALELEDLQLDGASVATTGVRFFKTGVIEQQSRLRRVRILNMAATGTGIDGSNGSGIADCYFDDVDLNGGGIGVSMGELDNQFYNCRFSQQAICGIDFNNGLGSSAGANFFGCIFSGNAIDFRVRSTLGPVSAHGCWFENSTTSVVTFVGAVGTAQIDFHGCTIGSAGANVINMTNLGAGGVMVFGGNWNPAGPPNIVTAASTAVVSIGAVNGNVITKTGAGVYLRMDSPLSAFAAGTLQWVAGMQMKKDLRRSTQAIAFAAAINVDATAGEQVQVGLLTGNIVINVPTNFADGQVLSFRFIHDATAGAYTVTFTGGANGFRLAGAALLFPNTNAGFARDAITFQYDAGLGTWVETSRAINVGP